MSALRKWLFTGLLVIVPGVITAWVLNWIVSTLDQTLQILPGAWHPDKLLGIHIPGFGVLLTLLILLVVGAVASNFAGRKLVQWANTNGGGTQFTDTGLPIGSLAIAAKDYKDNGNTDGLSSLAGSFSGMAAGFYHGDWAALVTALSTNSKNDILSTPSIVTMDNKEASFNVGQEVPVQSGSQSSTTSDQVFNTIERKTVGTKLVVTPQINEGDSVLLNIEQEVSSVAQTQAPGTSTLGPTFDTRTIKNAVLVKSGETVVLGGLMDEKTQEKVSKVPLLGDIPVLGYLFRSTSNSTSKRNLMVFIRPTILRDADVYSGISSNKYSQFRSEQQEAAAQEGYLTSPKRQVLPEYGQGVTMSPEVQKQLQQTQSAPQTSGGSQPFVGNK